MSEGKEVKLVKEKRNAVFTICFISSIILVFTIVDIFHSDRVFSETENRLLAVKPEFSVQELFFGNYTSDYEKYVTDQFVGRDRWIYLKTETDVFLQKKTVNGVYLASGDYLIEQHLPQSFTNEQVAEKMALLQPLIDEWDATVMLVPTADNILTEKLPAHVPYYDETVLLERIAELAGEKYVNAYAVLKEHNREPIYYRTDHHWTSLGAYYGYLVWAETVGVEPYPYDTEGMVTASREFLGTLHSKLNLDWQADNLQYFPETMAVSPEITYDWTRKTESYYEETYLDTKNKYGFFLDDNHALIEIETGYENGRTLFVMKDSYANCFIPLLAPHYEKIYVVDLRYYNGRLFELMEQYEPESGMDVLVLYNCIHFLEDFKYY